jgi:hypothetical protein
MPPKALSPWRALGIAPTKDRRQIRSAYARQLKLIDVERDPAAFQRLRAAYEGVLGGADPSRAAADAWTDPRQDEDDDRDDRREWRATAAAIREALDDDAVGEAFAALEAAHAQAVLPLAELRALEEALLIAAAPARSLSGETLARMVAHFDWDSSIHPLRRRHPKVFAMLDSRLDAEHWYGALVAQANRQPWFIRDFDRQAARRLLAGPPHWYEFLVAEQLLVFRRKSMKRLGLALDGFDRHEEWTRDRFDARRIRWCRGVANARPLRRAAILVFVACCALAGLTSPANALYYVGMTAYILVIVICLAAGIGAIVRRLLRWCWRA